jgi:O-antigen/teichoic acid export membrane protein
MKRLERTKNSVRNLIWGVINKLVSLFLPFLIRIFIINILGKEYLGLNNLFTSILNVLNLAELGIGSAMVYSMYEPIAVGDTKKICALLALYKKVYRIIGWAVFSIGICLLPFLKSLINGGTANINIYVLYLIFLADTVVSYWLFAYKNSLLNAHQRTDVSSNIGTIIHILLNFFQIIVLFIFKNYYCYIILKPIFTIINNLCIAYYTHKMYPEYEANGRISSDEMKIIFRRVRALMGHKIGTTVVTSADSLVISAFLGLGILAIYSNYYYIIYFVVSITGILFSGMLAGIGNSLLIETEEKNYSLFKNVNFITSWLVIWCSSCLLCLFQPFMTVWMGEDMLMPTSSLVWMVIYYFSWQFRTTGLYFKDAAGMWEADFWKPYVSAAVNLIMNIILVKIIGINGVFISTIFCMIFINFPWETAVLYKKLFKRKCTTYIINEIIIALEAVLICLISYLCCSFLNFGGVIEVIVKAIICLIVPNILFILFNYRKNEFRFLLSKITELVSKNK